MKKSAHIVQLTAPFNASLSNLAKIQRMHPPRAQTPVLLPLPKPTQQAHLSFLVQYNCQLAPESPPVGARFCSTPHKRMWTAGQQEHKETSLRLYATGLQIKLCSYITLPTAGGRSNFFFVPKWNSVGRDQKPKNYHYYSLEKVALHGASTDSRRCSNCAGLGLFRKQFKDFYADN